MEPIIPANQQSDSSINPPVAEAPPAPTSPVPPPPPPSPVTPPEPDPITPQSSPPVSPPSSQSASDIFVFKPSTAKNNFSLPTFKKVLLPAGIIAILILSFIITRNLSKKTQTQVPAREVTNCSTCRTWLADDKIGKGIFPEKPDDFTIETGRCKTYLPGACEVRGSDCYCGYSLCQLFGAITPTPTPTTILTPSPAGAASPTTTTTPVATATSTTTPIPTNTLPPGGAFNFNRCPWCAYAIPKGTSCGISRTIVESDAENVSAAIRDQRPGASPTYTPAQFASACTAYAGTRIRQGVQGEYCGGCCQGSSGPGPGNPTITPGGPTPTATGVPGACGCTTVKAFNNNDEEIGLNQLLPGQTVKIAVNGTGSNQWKARLKVYLAGGTNLIPPAACAGSNLIDGWCETGQYLHKPDNKGGYWVSYVVPDNPGAYNVEGQVCCEAVNTANPNDCNWTE